MSDLKMQSPNLVDNNIEKIATLFPNCITEAEDENGELKKVVDFDLLKQELSQTLVEGEQERYRLDWPGKKESILTANAPIAKTLRPVRDESVNFDTTENLFIEGDNLEALKLLQESYLGKVKMIYIDPPYNTGNDFIYEDDFAESTEAFLEKSNQVDEEGNRLIANTESNGRFHSDWLSMMYSRLKLARNLLDDKGVIFISIDDNEVNNIRKLCDEIFGETNFIEQFVWIKKTNPPNNVVIGSVHEYIVAYAKEIAKLELYLLPRNEEADGKYKNPDNDPRGAWTSGDLSAAAKGGRSTPSLIYKITNPNTGESFDPPNGRMWIVSKEVMEKNIKEGRIWWGADGKGRPKYKRFLSEVRQGMSISTLLTQYGNNGSASKELNQLYNGKVVFETPKPVSLLEVLMRISLKNKDLVLDFFAGSGTTAHAAMKFNSETPNEIKYILVQLPEEYNENDEGAKLGFENLAMACIDRIKKSSNVLNIENLNQNKVDTGFRFLKIDTSNMKDIYYKPDELNQADLLELASNIKEDRTAEDLLFQVMLDWGLELSLPIERKTIAGKEVFFVEGNSLVACFDDLSFELVDEVAKAEPLRFVSSENAIHQDQDKTNIKERFKQLSPETEVKFI